MLRNRWRRRTATQCTTGIIIIAIGTGGAGAIVIGAGGTSAIGAIVIGAGGTGTTAIGAIDTGTYCIGISQANIQWDYPTQFNRT